MGLALAYRYGASSANNPVVPAEAATALSETGPFGEMEPDFDVNTAMLSNESNEADSVGEIGENAEVGDLANTEDDDVVRTADERYVEYLSEPNGRKAKCVFDEEAETCAFVPAPDGSFRIMTVSGGGYSFEKVRPGLVDVTFYGAKPNPLGRFTWNKQDKACWDGSDQQICIY